MGQVQLSQWLLPRKVPTQGTTRGHRTLALMNLRVLLIDSSSCAAAAFCTPGKEDQAALYVTDEGGGVPEQGGESRGQAESQVRFYCVPRAARAALAVNLSSAYSTRQTVAPAPGKRNTAARHFDGLTLKRLSAKPLPPSTTS